MRRQQKALTQILFKRIRRAEEAAGMGEEAEAAEDSEVVKVSAAVLYLRE